MTAIVVGGHARKVGKTSMVAGLIAAFSNRPWTAVKISSHRHCGPEGSGGYEFHWETSCRGDSDTSRYLAAGASRSLWVQAGEDSYGAAVQQLLPLIQSDPFLIIESNRILKFIEPDLCILVLNYDVHEFKDSACEMLAKADAAVAVNSPSKLPAWKEIPPGALTRIPIFSTTDLQVPPQEFLEFVQARCPALRRLATNLHE
jgi:hypothetical protein